MSTALQTCAARIECALEYLAHESDPIKAIVLAETQLRQALISLRAASPVETRRAEDKAPALTFEASEKVRPSAWPPAAKAAEETARLFRPILRGVTIERQLPVAAVAIGTEIPVGSAIWLDDIGSDMAPAHSFGAR
jgi:hypothetical protein